MASTHYDRDRLLSGLDGYGTLTVNREKYLIELLNGCVDT